MADAIAIFDRLIGKFASAPDPEVGSYVGWALLNRAFALSGLGRHSDALLDYEEAIADWARLTPRMTTGCAR